MHRQRRHEGDNYVVVELFARWSRRAVLEDAECRMVWGKTMSLDGLPRLVLRQSEGGSRNLEGVLEVMNRFLRSTNASGGRRCIDAGLHVVLVV